MAWRQRWICGMDTPPPKRLHVMVDIDDVIFPLIDNIHARAERAGLHDGDVLPEWNPMVENGWDEKAYWDLWSDMALDGDYISTPPVEGSVEALRRLLWAGHAIHLVTARGFMAHRDEIRSWTHDWVDEFAVPHETLTFARDKPAVQGVLEVRFDYAIDDSPKNYAELDNDGVKVYLQDHPHNRRADVARRVPSVDAFVDLICQEAS